VRLRAVALELDAAAFLTALLEDVATSCLVAGTSVIGHLKCVLRLPGTLVHCSLVSVRSGAQCVMDGAGPGLLRPGEETELALAVLVYGLPAGAIDALVEEGLERLLSPPGVRWSKEAVFYGSDH
jgi:hypothetical protein